MFFFLVCLFCQSVALHHQSIVGWGFSLLQGDGGY